ncbi:hypothetical protein [Actinoplanes awajinensis]|nr:hypothetical protein [Actinoplanes awajinensis]
MNEPQTGRGTLVVIGGYLALLAIGATRLLAGVVRDWWRDRRRPR